MSKNIGFVASETLADAIEEEADELGLNKSEVIRNHLARSMNDD